MQERKGNAGDSDASSLTPAERELEIALGSMSPSSPMGVDRSRALFDAGVAVGRGRAKAWRGMTAVLALAFAAYTIGRERGGGTGGLPDGSGAAVAVNRAESWPPATETPTAPQLAVATRMPAATADAYGSPFPTSRSDRPAYLRMRDQILHRGDGTLSPAEAVAAPLWLPDPAPRRVILPDSAARG